MISKGRNVSSLFPHVVKCVVVDSAEIRRLAHMYITHYAEFEPDVSNKEKLQYTKDIPGLVTACSMVQAALLCINHFQRDLENHNQLLRAHALRHISSIRLNVCVFVLLFFLR